MSGLLKILYHDDDLVAIDKPCNLLVHRTRISGDHMFALQLLRDQLSQFVFPVHRLDRPTSGVLLFALSKEAARSVCDAFADRRVEKTYVAVVRGYAEETGVIDHPLGEPGDEPPREALTRYRRVATAECPEAVGPHPTARYSLLSVRPETGRTHQIRRHLKHVSHPIIGDSQHGDGRHNRFFRERFGVGRLLLHARTLVFPHPRTSERIVVEAPLHEEMVGLFERLGWGEGT
jgi:tRNA pseudouridine65 synthase